MSAALSLLEVEITSLEGHIKRCEQQISNLGHDLQVAQGSKANAEKRLAEMRKAWVALNNAPKSVTAEEPEPA